MLQSGMRFRWEPSPRACLLGLIAWDHLYIQVKVENKINQNKIYIFKLRGILGRGPLRPPSPPPGSLPLKTIRHPMIYMCILIISISCLRNDGWAESPSQVGRLYGAGGQTVQIMTQTDRPIHFEYSEITLRKMYFFSKSSRTIKFFLDLDKIFLFYCARCLFMTFSPI